MKEYFSDMVYKAQIGDKEESKNAALLRVFSDVLSAAHPDDKADFEDKLLDATRILTELAEEDKTVDYFAIIIIYLLL